MKSLLVCQLLGGHTLCSRVIDHGTSAGLSAPGGSYTVFQVIDHGTSAGLSAPGGVIRFMV